MTQVFNDQNFNEAVIEASKVKPVLVDFYANWCGACQVLGPIVDDLANDMGEKAVIGKINTEENMNIATEHNIMSLPTLLLFRNGEVVENWHGIQFKDNLVEAINKYL